MSIVTALSVLPSEAALHAKPVLHAEPGETDPVPAARSSALAAPLTGSLLETARTCRLVTLGCKVNQYETQLLLEGLERNGFREAAEGEPADLCVVNTCTVTNNGDSRSRQVVRQLAKENPDARTLVIGCSATRDAAAFARLPNVFAVVGDKRELPDVLARQGIVDLPTGISRFDGRKRAYVKVQDGCILRCSYCIIPQVRPGLTSRPPADIVAEVRRLLDRGYQEIVLTGVHVGHYGVEATRGRSGRPPYRLWHLFRELDRLPGDWRMRLSSVEAVELNDEFIAAAADCEHLCPQFHPALQSGSTTVLQRMRRRYTAEKFLQTVEKLHARLDRPALTTDVIVGFPGETEAEFAETLATCRAARFSKIHAFPFSPRQGTPAATLPNHVDGVTKKQRMARLADLERELACDVARQFVGETLEVMAEGIVPASEYSTSMAPAETPTPSATSAPRVWLHGTDRRYLPVRFPGDVRDLARLVNVRAMEVTGAGLLIGEPL